MKVAVFIEQGVTQLVLTPETKWEKSVTQDIKSEKVTLYRGGFYDCQGGWTRQNTSDDSLIFVIEQTQEQGG